ncbi:MAG: Acetyltransferase [Candidatus Carbobacillus altaicus]|uniref:Acetyltransferase n=1 Tax=Candidatus Carbonibacillus altaicus TaxID=2163959 RepID=A0A2R6Y1T7_9BACL|nr:MAG: Acetyltransferase [Candidatus Carbobacillus altaicus]
MMIHWTPLERTDLSSLVALWNRELSDRFPMREALFAQNSFDDPNVCWPGSWVARDGDRGDIVGFVVAKAPQEAEPYIEANRGTAWIQVLLVDRRYRCRGIGSELLLRAERALFAHEAERISLGRDPWHFFPGIPVEDGGLKRWFEARGYVGGDDVYDMHCVLRDDAVMPKLPEVAFRLLALKEKDSFLAFMRRSFPGRWTYEAVKYFERGGTGREFVVAVKGDRIIGFCRVNDASSPLIAQNTYWTPLFDDDALGGIGPLGIDSAERGHGYGLAIVQAGMAVLRGRGIKHVIIDWTGLVDFYGKMGCKVWKGYTIYQKGVQIKPC